MKHVRLALAVILLATSGALFAEPYEMPALTKAEPANQATLAGPVTEVVLEFADEVDLVQVDLIAPDQTKTALYKADGSATDKRASGSR